MTATLLEEIENAPPEDAPDLFGSAVVEDGATEDAPRRTRQRRPRKPRVDDDGNPLPPVTRQPRNAKLSEDLLEGTVTFASGLSAVAPTVAGVLVARAEVLTDGLVALASGRKRTTAVLRKVSSVSKMAGMLETLALVAVAIGVDTGRIPVESPILDNIGFADLVKDDKGKLVKDERGMVVKDRKTLRDVYNIMHPEQQYAQPEHAPMPHWSGQSPDTGSGPTVMPPMNWVP